MKKTRPINRAPPMRPLTSPPQPWKHPTLMPQSGEDDPVPNGASWIYEPQKNYPVVRWSYARSMFDPGFGWIHFFVEGVQVPQKYKYQMRISSAHDEETIRMLAENAMILLNLKDGV
jgi:hypothetical protein